MPENDKINSMLAMLRGVLKGKKEECSDIVTQAEKVVSDYINKRKNEIVNKYCKKRNGFWMFLIYTFSGAALYFVYSILK